MIMSRKALRRRVAALMVDYGVKGYDVTVGACGDAWAHCDFDKRRLVFSPKLLWCDWVFVNQIILHEVAHALAGSKAAHGRAWLDTARGMGYRLGVKVAYSDPIKGVHHWVARCLTGEHSAIRFERTYEDGERDCLKCWEGGAGAVPVVWDRL